MASAAVPRPLPQSVPSFPSHHETLSAVQAAQSKSDDPEPEFGKIEPLPREILTFYAPLYDTVQAWWSNSDINPKQKDKIDQVNVQIRAWNEKNSRPENKDFFPYLHLNNMIRMTSDYYEKLKTDSSLSSRFADHVLLMCAQLEGQGYQVDKMLTKDWAQLLMQLLENQTNEQAYNGLKKVMTRVATVTTWEQRMVLERASKPLQDLFHFRSNAQDVWSELCNVNDSLRVVNERMGIASEDHVFDLDPLQELQKVSDNDDYKSQLACYLQSLVSTGHFPESEANDAVLRQIPDSDRNAIIAKSKSKLASPYFKETMDGDSDVDMLSTSSQDGNVGLAEMKQQTSQSLGSSHLARPVASTKDAARSDSLFTQLNSIAEDVHLEPEPGSKITEFGEVVALRPSGRNQFRVFVNRGTERAPYWRAFPGSTFGRNRVEAWKKDKALLAAGKTDSVEMTKIKAVVQCIMMPDSAVHYFQVLLEHAAGIGSSRHMIITKSDLRRWRSDRYMREQMYNLLCKRDKMRKLLNAFVDEGKHPGHENRQLTASDKNHTPWFSRSIGED